MVVLLSCRSEGVANGLCLGRFIAINRRWSPFVPETSYIRRFASTDDYLHPTCVSYAGYPWNFSPTYIVLLKTMKLST